MNITDLIAEIGLTEEQSAPILDWVSQRESVLAQEKAAATEAATAAERAAQSAAQDMAQRAWDAVRATVTAERDTLAAQAATLQSGLSELLALRDSMFTRVVAVLTKGDPDEMRALAADFITPEVEKLRAAKLAQIAALQAELDGLIQP